MDQTFQDSLPGNSTLQVLHCFGYLLRGLRGLSSFTKVILFASSACFRSALARLYSSAVKRPFITFRMSTGLSSVMIPSIVSSFLFKNLIACRYSGVTCAKAFTSLSFQPRNLLLSPLKPFTPCKALYSLMGLPLFDCLRQVR